MIKAIIFDYYGVISSDEYHNWLSSRGIESSQGMKDLSLSLDKGTITLDKFFEDLSKLCGVSAKEIKQEFKVQANLNQSLLALILRLKDRYKIGLLSNASSSHLRDSMRQANIDHLFDAIIISSDIGYTKPAKEIFHYALDKLAVKADEALFIDDRQRFVEAANALGIKSIFYCGLDSLTDDLKQMGIIEN